VEPGRMSFEEQVRIFAQAKIIVGAHGAGLTNVVWAAPGAELLEFMPEHLEDVGYRFLSVLAGHRHNCIRCRQFKHEHGPAFADIEVDIPILRAALSNLVRQLRE
jgi:capsular polysaccharide biosynthesis protein